MKIFWRAAHSVPHLIRCWCKSEVRRAARRPLSWCFTVKSINFYVKKQNFCKPCNFTTNSHNFSWPNCKLITPVIHYHLFRHWLQHYKSSWIVFIMSSRVLAFNFLSSDKICRSYFKTDSFGVDFCLLQRFWREVHAETVSFKVKPTNPVWRKEIES